MNKKTFYGILIAVVTAIVIEAEFTIYENP